MHNTFQIQTTRLLFTDWLQQYLEAVHCAAGYRWLLLGRSHLAWTLLRSQSNLPNPIFCAYGPQVPNKIWLDAVHVKLLARELVPGSVIVELTCEDQSSVETFSDLTNAIVATYGPYIIDNGSTGAAVRDQAGDQTPALKATAGRLLSLTPREKEVADLWAQGLTVAKIAEQLLIAKGTVRKYLDSIRQKLKVHLGREEDFTGETRQLLQKLGHGG